MKKIHIFLLLCVGGAVAVLVSIMGSLTTFDTVQTARNKPGKFVHLIARLDRTQPIQYDAVNNPNFLMFAVRDSIGDSITVVYRNPKPDNLEISDRLVLKGSFQGSYFDCKEILLKCPSKYKEEIKIAASQELNIRRNRERK